MSRDERPLRTPSSERIRQTNLARFLAHVRTLWGVDLPDYSSLHDWSATEPERFWTALWDFCGIVAERRGERVVVDRERMPGRSCFPEAQLNFAENLLRRRDDAEAIVFRDEEGHRRTLTFRELYEETARLSEALRELGVHAGDRVAGVLPNIPEAVVAMLATATVGGVWFSLPPVPGPEAALDRLERFEPKILFTVDGCVRGGEHRATLGGVRRLVEHLPTLRAVVIVPHLDPDVTTGGISIAHRLPGLLAAYPTSRARFVRVPFGAPYEVLYASGTGRPEAVVHGVGKTLLRNLGEHTLRNDLRRNDRVLGCTDCGSAAWSRLVSALASEATVILRDGDPFRPGPEVLFDAIDEEKATHLFAPAACLEEIRNLNLEPKRTHSLASLRGILPADEPVARETADYVRTNVKGDVLLCPGSGDVILPRSEPPSGAAGSG